MATNEITQSSTHQIAPFRAIGEIGLLFISIILGGVLAAIWPDHLNGAFAIPTFISVLVPVLVATLLLHISGQSWRDLGATGRGSFFKTLFLGSILTLIVLLLYAVGTSLLSSLGFPSMDVSELSDLISGNIIAYLFWMVFVVWGSAGVGEELIARGFLMNRLEAFFTKSPSPMTLAVVIQAILFGLAHSYQGPIGIILSGSVGLLFGCAYYRFGRNLLILIVAHGLVDTLAITAIYMDSFFS